MSKIASWLKHMWFLIWFRMEASALARDIERAEETRKKIWRDD